MHRNELHQYLNSAVQAEYPSLCKALICDASNDIMSRFYSDGTYFIAPKHEHVIKMFVAYIRHQQTDYEEMVIKAGRNGAYRQFKKNFDKKLLKSLESFKVPPPVVQKPKYVPDAVPDLGTIMDEALT